MAYLCVLRCTTLVIHPLRPLIPLSCSSGWEDSWGLLRYGDLMRTTRRLANRVLSSTACRNHILLQEHAVLRFVQKMYEQPQNLFENASWCVLVDPCGSDVNISPTNSSGCRHISS